VSVQRVTLQRHTEDDGAEVWIVSDEGGEFARAGRISDALHYASDLMHGPGTGPRGSVWNLMRAMEDYRDERSTHADQPPR
jgi:hypothetical protein